MGRRNSRTQNRRRHVEDKMVERCKRKLKPLKEDDYDNENSSMLPILHLKDMTKRERDAMKANKGRSVMYMPDSDDDGGWVPEKGTTSDDGFYKKWFRNNKEDD